MKIMNDYKYRILILIGTQREFLRAVEKNIISLKEYKLFNKYIAEDRWFEKYHSPEIIYRDISIKISTFLNYAFEWCSKPDYGAMKFINIHNKIKEKIYNKKSI